MTLRRSGFFGLAALGLCLAVAAVMSGVAAADWHDELARQIEHDKSCKVNFISHVVERYENGKRLIMAKVQCEDKRAFDAFRAGDDHAFEFKACEVPNAETF